jgi:triacylglycerol lipase
MSMRPVIVAHGMWDNRKRIAPLVKGLAARGIRELHAVEFTPASGLAPLEVLAQQLASYIDEVAKDREIDLVGFSMGALISRTYLGLLGGHARVKTFVSISGPHRGSLLAHLLPLPGIRQMRPGSPFLRALDGAAFGATAVHCLYTPYDAMVFPGSNGILASAKSVHAFPVLHHRAMLTDPRVLDKVVALLDHRES